MEYEIKSVERFWELREEQMNNQKPMIVLHFPNFIWIRFFLKPYILFPLIFLPFVLAGLYYFTAAQTDYSTHFSKEFETVVRPYIEYFFIGVFIFISIYFASKLPSYIMVSIIRAIGKKAQFKIVKHKEERIYTMKSSDPRYGSASDWFLVHHLRIQYSTGRKVFTNNRVVLWGKEYRAVKKSHSLYYLPALPFITVLSSLKRYETESSHATHVSLFFKLRMFVIIFIILPGFLYSCYRYIPSVCNAVPLYGTYRNISADKKTNPKLTDTFKDKSRLLAVIRSGNRDTANLFALTLGGGLFILIIAVLLLSYAKNNIRFLLLHSHCKNHSIGYVAYIKKSTNNNFNETTKAVIKYVAKVYGQTIVDKNNNTVTFTSKGLPFSVFPDKSPEKGKKYKIIYSSSQPSHFIITKVVND